MDETELNQIIVALTALCVQSMERTTNLAKVVAVAVPNLPQKEKEQLLAAIETDLAGIEESKGLLRSLQSR